MRLGLGIGENFFSHRTFEFDYSGQGLALIMGPSGAGKSGILDFPDWVLFGETSKDGNSDEVRSWNTTEPTWGSQEVHLADRKITIFRMRGATNDLYFKVNDGEPIRGANVTDTQKKINTELGVDSKLFTSVCYFHQFSDASLFFTAKADQRRPMFESIADLSFAKKLSETFSEQKKLLNKELTSLNTGLAVRMSSVDQTRSAIKEAQQAYDTWELSQNKIVTGLIKKRDEFETERADERHRILERMSALDKILIDPQEFVGRVSQINTQLEKVKMLNKRFDVVNQSMTKVLTEISGVEDSKTALAIGVDTCPCCLQKTDATIIETHVAELDKKLNDLSDKLILIVEEKNNLEEAVSCEASLNAGLKTVEKERRENDALITKYKMDKALEVASRAKQNIHIEWVESAQKTVNPYLSQIDNLTIELQTAESLKCQTLTLLSEQKRAFSKAEWLYDHSFVLRSMQLENVVQTIENGTNACLREFFDAEVTVRFKLKDTDKVDVILHKSGNLCTYKQLSGGQRCMLALSFWVARIEAAESKAKVRSQTLLLDEAIRWMDPDVLKPKAFRLLEDLSKRYDSMIVVEHDKTLQSMFHTKFNVSLEGDASRIEKA